MFSADTAYAVVPPCNATIRQSIVLTGDMSCPGNGLNVGASNITVDLNGHTIDGPGPDVRPAPNQIFAGIRVLPGVTGSTVKNGRIQEFTIGVTTQVGADNNTFTGLTLVNNGEGILTQLNPTTGVASNGNRFIGNVIEGSTGANGPAVFLNGDGNVFTENEVRSNVGTGVTLTGDNNTVSENQVVDNTGAGIVLQGSASTSADNNTVSQNTVQGNGNTGIQVNGDNNLVSGNTVANNGGNGINVGGQAAPRRWVGNRIEDNTVTGNGRPGVALPGIGLFAASSTIVRNNTVVGIQAASGISVSGSDGAQILGNHVSNNTDGIFVQSAATSTNVDGNDADHNVDDGIDVDSPSTRIANNSATFNGDLGIEAVAGVTDGGGNRAAGNGNPRQCSPTIRCATDGGGTPPPPSSTTTTTSIVPPTTSTTTTTLPSPSSTTTTTTTIAGNPGCALLAQRIAQTTDPAQRQQLLLVFAAMGCSP